MKRKESELNNIRSQMAGLETRLKYSINDRDNTVSSPKILPRMQRDKGAGRTLANGRGHWSRR